MNPARKVKKEKVIKITTFEDIIDVLKRRPKWREEMRQLILTEELMRLPAKVDKLSERFDGFVKEEFHPLRNKVDTIEGDVSTLKQDVTVLKEDVSVLKQDVSTLKQDVEVLKQDVQILKQDVAVLKQDVEILKQDVEALKKDVTILKNDVAYLKGTDLERTVRERAPAYFGKLIRRCRVINFEDLADKLEDAVDARLISEEEKDDALLIDVVVRGRLRTDKEVLLAAEVSVKIDSMDVERAAKRAEIIARAFNMETIPVAFGKERTEGAQLKADELTVVLCP